MPQDLSAAKTHPSLRVPPFSCRLLSFPSVGSMTYHACSHQLSPSAVKIGLLPSPRSWTMPPQLTTKIFWDLWQPCISLHSTIPLHLIVLLFVYSQTESTPDIPRNTTRRVIAAGNTSLVKNSYQRNEAGLFPPVLVTVIITLLHPVIGG